MDERSPAHIEVVQQDMFTENTRELALKALGAGVWLLNSGSEILQWNERCYELFDHAPGLVTIDSWLERVHSDDKRSLLDVLTNCPADGSRFDLDFRACCGIQEKWIRLSGYLIAADIENNIPEYISGVMADITEEKNANKKLEDLNFTKDRFFSIIAHDLRSPFTSILGFSRLMHEEYDDFSDDERKMMIKQILSSTESTFQLLDNLLTWAKSQLGRVSFNPEFFDMGPLVNEALVLASAQAKIKDISLRAMLMDKAIVFADVNMIRTILRNLLSNAIKYTFAGGTITVETSRVKDKINICVTDTGTGIEKSTLNALFSLDKKVCSMKGTANEKGSGLGLILCKEFVEKNGGTITVESHQDKGSKFSFTLPVK